MLWGSCSHSGSTSGLLVLVNTAPAQRRRGCSVVSRVIYCASQKRNHTLLMSIVSSYKCLIVNINWLKLALNMNLSLMKVVFGYANLTKTNPEKCK